MRFQIQNQMIETILNDPKRTFFLTYAFIWIGYGFTLSCIGPLIPYLSAKFGTPETQFGFFFVSRSIGFTIGCLLSKFLNKYFSYHQLIILSVSLASLSFIVFAFINSVSGENWCLFLSSIGLGCLEIFSSLAIIESHKGNRQQFWLQITHGIGTVGCFISPLLIALLQLKGLVLVAIFLVLPLYKLSQLQSPELQENGQSKENEKMQDESKIQLIVQFYICLSLFLLFGLVMGYGGWISSYLTIQGLQTKEGGAFVTGVFWASMSFFTFALSNWDGKIDEKMFKLLKLLIFILIIAIFLENIGFVKFSAYFTSITLGAAFASMYALILGTPIHFGKILCPSSTSNILIVACLGEGSVSSVFGFFMEKLGSKSFYVMLLVFTILMTFAYSKAVALLRPRIQQLSKRATQNSLEEMLIVKQQK